MRASAYESMRAMQAQHWWWRGMASLYDKALKRFTVPGREYRVVDVGCGFGANLPVLGNYGDVVGVDLSLEALCAIEKRPTLGLVQARADALPFRAGSFDIVALLAVVEHVKCDAAVFKEAHRIACPGAIQMLLTTAFNVLWSHHDEANNHFRRYRAKTINQLQAAAGWHVLLTSYINAMIFPGAFIIRILQRLTRINGGPHFDMGPNLPILANLLGLETSLTLRFGWRFPCGVNLLSIARRTK